MYIYGGYHVYLRWVSCIFTVGIMHIYGGYHASGNVLMAITFLFSNSWYSMHMWSKYVRPMA